MGSNPAAGQGFLRPHHTIGQRDDDRSCEGSSLMDRCTPLNFHSDR